MGHVCIVLDKGWIIEGNRDGNTVADANVVRRWDNGRGIGGLAKAEYKSEYVLDPLGTVRINPDAVIYEFELEW